MFQAAQLTTHDIDADSAIGTCTSVITDNKSSCRFSDDEEVSECVYVYHNTTICTKVDNICVVDFSKSSSVHMHNIESLNIVHMYFLKNSWKSPQHN